ncbi:hypothetical protein BvCms1816_02360 [Escherichia coli]|uniref:Uncharacterized protein n=1 Tax=Escherichia coli TaxID=562 RepID=A0A478KLG0_ECOLX|nr:hypothetical protein BvCmsH19A_00149 [Escherichia coli]GCN85602.1 hypothetical protein BvCms1816_02360 [Escherichia coli]SQY40968.1 Uncharacterised protein [Escherichia coli]
MEFKDLPLSIQEIAAHTLRQRLNEAMAESATKETIDNMARNVHDAFTGLYFCASVNKHDPESVAKKIAETTVQNINTKPTEDEIDQPASEQKKKNRHMRETCLFMTNLSEYVAKFRLNTWQEFTRHYLKIWKRKYLMATPTVPSWYQLSQRSGIKIIAGMLLHGYSATKLLPWKLRRVFATC